MPHPSGTLAPRRAAAQQASDAVIGSLVLANLAGIGVLVLAVLVVLLLFGVFLVALVVAAFQQSADAGLAALGALIGIPSLLLLALSRVMARMQRARARSPR